MIFISYRSNPDYLHVLLRKRNYVSYVMRHFHATG